MNGYVIGAGAVLRAGPQGSITAAALHAQTDPALARGVKAAIIDFEASSCSELSQIVIVASGWGAARFEREVTQPLIRARESTLQDVFTLLSTATAAGEVHLFARWLPPDTLAAALRRAGIEVIAHPLESIMQSALISGGSYQRLPSMVRAA